jgi:hypothetical protein
VPWMLIPLLWLLWETFHCTSADTICCLSKIKKNKNKRRRNGRLTLWWLQRIMSNLFRAIYKSDYHLSDRINNTILSPHTFTNASTPVQLGCHGQPEHASSWSETSCCLQPCKHILQTKFQGANGVSVGSDLATAQMHPCDGLDYFSSELLSFL